MRLKALIPNHPQLDIAIIYQESPTSYYLYVVSEDYEYGFDNWSPDLHSIKFNCKKNYDIAESAWEEIPDVLQGALPQYEIPTVAVKNDDGIVIDFISYDEALNRGILSPKPYKLEISDDSEIVDEVRMFLDKGDPLRAMQVYMKRTGCNLLKAKQAIEYIKENHS